MDLIKKLFNLSPGQGKEKKGTFSVRQALKIADDRDRAAAEITRESDLRKLRQDEHAAAVRAERLTARLAREGREAAIRQSAKRKKDAHDREHEHEHEVRTSRSATDAERLVKARERDQFNQDIGRDLAWVMISDETMSSDGHVLNLSNMAILEEILRNDEFRDRWIKKIGSSLLRSNQQKPKERWIRFMRLRFHPDHHRTNPAAFTRMMLLIERMRDLVSDELDG